MKKINLSIVLLAGVMTTIATACTNDDDSLDNEATQNTNVKKSPVKTNGNDDTFSFTSAHDQSITVKVTGDSVAVSRSVLPSTVINGKLVYSNAYSGYLEMRDETFSTKKIPFEKSSKMLRLDFEGTNDFGGNTVFLTQPNTSSFQGSDGVIDAISSEQAQNVMSSVTKGIIKLGLDKIFFGGIGDKIAAPFLDLIFPSSSGTDYSKDFANIENQLSSINDHIKNLSQQIHKKDLTDKYKEHWELIKTMDNNNFHTKDLLSNNPEDSVSILSTYAESCMDKYRLSAYIETIMEEYFYSFGGTNTFQDLDEYLVTSYPFLDKSTPERYLYRAEDLKVIMETVQLINKYWQIKNAPGSAAQLQRKATAFLDRFAEAERFDAHENQIVCTIPDAYFVMWKDAKLKKFGELEFASGKFNPNDFKIYNDEINEAKWGGYYVYSQKGVGARSTEINDLCLKYDEAQKLVSYFGNRNLYDILTKEAGMTGIDDTGVVMLLGDYAYIDKDRGWSSTYYNIKTRVWDTRTNKYDGDFLIDALLKASRGFTFTQHVSNARAYYTQITDHFYKNNEKDYDTFMQFVWKAPGEDPKDNPEN